MAEPDVAVDAVLGHGLAQVGEDRRTIGDRLGSRPWLEPVAQRVHVAVGPHPGIPEQVPRAADVLTTLEDQVRPIVTHRLEVVAGADAGDACTDDQHVDVFDRHGVRSPLVPAEMPAPEPGVGIEPTTT
jgi:hypothetical protein